jgi:DNA-binding transcriptional ArsR family regulator
MMRQPAAAKPAGRADLIAAARELRPHAARAAELLKVLGNEQRLMILCHLLSGPLSVAQINERVPLSQSALSQHLAVLRAAGIVVTHRRSQSVIYSLPRGFVVRIIGVLQREFCPR